MKIAQVAPLYEAVPPRLYGGTERIVAHLSNALVELGHEVTLFASAEAHTRATLVPVRDQAIRLGIFAALGILGGTSALLAAVLFAIAFLRGPRKPRARAEDALRAVADPVQASTAVIARAADEAVNGAADIVRNGSRQQIAGTIAAAALIGWVLGRQF